MKKIIVFASLLVALLLAVTGCKIVVADPAAESSATEESVVSTSSAPVEYELIETVEESFHDYLIPEDSTITLSDSYGFSLTSTLPYEETVAFYQGLIQDFSIQGTEQTVNTEALGIEAGWKYDGVYNDELFSVSVALSKAGEVGVAVVYSQ